MIVTFLSMMIAQPAAPAQTVGEALAEGRVGERYDGYLDFVEEPGVALSRAVRDLNIRRRALYGELAERRRVAPEEVGIAAGCNLMARTQAGGYYRTPQGWQQRLAGSPVVLPDYCNAPANASIAITPAG
ncbi:YdbL family protein [Sphingomicrobium flavum]|uniref:YdbL family protein n=1 Tax=Sphingomicrobium flavum TaxID=1229164 RepID=UPI0021AD965B|nr:YdbL family protein [Sphingomicrobium flavum]